MNRLLRIAAIGSLLVGGVASFGQRVPQGTQVTLVFDQALSSKTAKVGDPVKLHVKNSVMVNGRTVLRAGTKVTGVISKVDKRRRYGVNAEMRIALNPVRAGYGMVTLEPRTKGKVVGNRTGQAAAATAGGAIVLGPIGLVGGYFVVGKEVNIKSGDVLETEVSKYTARR